MSTVTVTVCGTPRQLPADWTLAQTIEAYTPYGEEAVICRLNGSIIRSIDTETAQPMGDGDVLEIYPLIIGG